MQFPQCSSFRDVHVEGSLELAMNAMGSPPLPEFIRVDLHLSGVH